VGTPYAQASDIAARWRPLSTDEAARAAVLAGDASALLRAEFPGIDDQIASGAVDSTLLTIVVAGMVKRALLAPPDGMTQQSETAGPYSQSQSYANPLGNVFLTAAERTLIEGRQPTGGSFRYSNDTSRGPFTASDLSAAYDGGINY
jgi:hypothetical protein